MHTPQGLEHRHREGQPCARGMEWQKRPEQWVLQVLLMILIFIRPLDVLE